MNLWNVREHLYPPWASLRRNMYRVRGLLVDEYWRIVNPTQAYRRFIILGQERTGSTYLQTLLKSHSQIVAQGEVLHLVAKKTHDLREIVRQPVEYIEKSVYKHYPWWIDAVGCKLMYSHLGRDCIFLHELDTTGWAEKLKAERESFWYYMQSNFDLVDARKRFDGLLEYLINDLDLVILHVKRRNRLNAFLSLKLATASDVWRSSRGAYPLEPIHLDVDECVAYFAKSEHLEMHHDDLFASHPKVDVIYEDLVAQPDVLLASVLEQLGVEPRALNSPLKKQNTLRNADRISNYAELAGHFRGSKFAEFFDW